MENNLGSGNPPQKHLGDLNKNLTKLIRKTNLTNDLLRTISEDVIDIKSTLSAMNDLTIDMDTTLKRIKVFVKSIDSKIEEPVPV